MNTQITSAKMMLKRDSTMCFDTWTTLSSIANMIGIRAYVITLDLTSRDFKINKISITEYRTWNDKYDIEAKLNQVQVQKYNVLNFIVWSYAKIIWTDILSTFGQIACPKILRVVHLCGQKHQTTTSKATTQQPQLCMFVFHVRQPPYLCTFVI